MTLEQAAALHQAGRLDDARRAYQALLAERTAPPGMVLQLLALLHVQRHAPAEALAAYDALITLGEADAEAHQARGDVLQTLGRPAHAVDAYDAAVALSPAAAQAWNNRGMAFERMGEDAAAAQSFARALQERPNYAEAAYNLGGALSALDRPADALDALELALRLRPGWPAALNNRGLALAALGRFEAAEADYAAAIALRPEDPHAWANRSAALRALHQPQAALDAAEQALALAPDHPGALNGRGLALAALNRFEAALESYRQALAARPGDANVLNNTGLALTALGRFDAAKSRHIAALDARSGFAEAQFNLALLALRLGDQDGWRLHEARWRRQGQPGPTFPDRALWLGESDVAGQTLLLHAEQGLGDTLQFVRYAKAVKTLGARVVLQVQPPLKRLMATLDGADQVVAIGEPLPPLDRHIPLMSLPLAVGGWGTAPPYLAAKPEAVARWRTRLDETIGADRPRIGLCWAGNPAHGDDRNRSIPLVALQALPAHEVAFVSLQKDAPDRDRDALRAAGLHPFPAGIEDFADTAALIGALDLVISVDTSVAHLAGALGRPLWLLLPRHADWRWGEGRVETPWYPSARLYRQPAFDDWPSAIAEVAAALDAWIAARA